MSCKLNLGCGNKKIEGYIGVDIMKTNATDVIHNLDVFPYPFAPDSISEALMDNVLEHLSNPLGVLEEMYRICAPGAIIKIKVPYFKSNGAFTDITHKKFFSENSFDFLSDDHEYRYYSAVNFQVIKKELIAKKYSRKHIWRNLLPGKKFLNYFLFNIYDEIYFELKCLK